MENLPKERLQNGIPPSQEQAEAMHNVFVETLCDVYTLKKNLLTYLPLLANKAHFKALRNVMIETSINISSQIMRMDLIFNILSKTHKKEITASQGCLQIDGYIKNDLSGNGSLKTDVAVLTHLILIEEIEVGSYSLMLKMNEAVEDGTIHDLIKQNLYDAAKCKTNLGYVLDGYLTN